MPNVRPRAAHLGSRWETFAFSFCSLFCFETRGETPAIQIPLLNSRFRNLHRTWKVNLCNSLPMIYHCNNAVRQGMPMIVLLSIYSHFICFYFSAPCYLDVASCTPSSCSSTPTSSTRPFETMSL